MATDVACGLTMLEYATIDVSMTNRLVCGPRVVVVAAIGVSTIKRALLEPGVGLGTKTVSRLVVRPVYGIVILEVMTGVMPEVAAGVATIVDAEKVP